MNKQLLNACLGNLFEHYETALFGFLSPFLAPVMFPNEDPLTALILTYTIIPLGMFAKPLGALIFGYIGDTYGRERSLFLTLVGMALISGCIALTPTYQQVGVLAPLFLFFGRALQSFFSAGETMGGAIYMLENTSTKHHDLVSSFYSASAMGGHLLASLGVFIIGQYFLIDPGWRVLYLCGCITALFGCLLRRSVRKPQSSAPRVSSNMCTTLWSNRSALLTIILAAGFAHATYSVALVLMNGYIPLVTSLTKAEAMKINTYLILFDFCLLPLFGWIASRVSRANLMLLVSIGAVILSTPLLVSLKDATLTTVIGVRVTFVIFGVAFFAPFHAWAQQLVSESSRYIVISFGYAIGSQLLGSPTAAISLGNCCQFLGNDHQLSPV
jgi:MHS family proline/betaine transporter-like MFS transporter